MNKIIKSVITAFLTLIIIAALLIAWPQPDPSPPPPSPTEIGINVTPTSTSTPMSIPRLATTLPTNLLCEPQYLPEEAGWVSSHQVRSSTSLGELYSQKYGEVRRDNLDLYAMVYYNNRKALEEGSYNVIDPVKLTVDGGWRLFFPPRVWIDEYRNYPIPVLDAIIDDDASSTINISGTSILYPLSSQISNCFKEATKPYQIQVKSTNTMLGLIDYCQGSADLFGASEEITQEMKDASGCTSVDFQKFVIANYAIVIFVNNGNPFVDDLIRKPPTRDELERLLVSADSWRGVRSTWDNLPINRYYPPMESGMFEVVKKKIFPNLITETAISNLSVTNDDNLLISQVVNDNYSIGITGYPSYKLNINNLKSIPVDNISPSFDAVNSDNPSYPLISQLYLYTGTTTYNEKPLIRFFISYYLAYEFDFLEELGYLRPNNFDLLNNPNTIP